MSETVRVTRDGAILEVVLDRFTPPREPLRMRSQRLDERRATELLDGLEQSHPALVRNLVPKPLSVPLLAEILRRLVEEHVSIRPLREILEGLAPYAAQEKDPIVLADLARQALQEDFVTGAVINATLSEAGSLSISARITLTDGLTYALEVGPAGAINQLGGTQRTTAEIQALIASYPVT